jgi:hypothetical protein
VSEGRLNVGRLISLLLIFHEEAVSAQKAETSSVE